jgi:hypothetical protein
MKTLSIMLKKLMSKKWVCPAIFIIICLLLLSTAVTYIKNDRKKTQEFLTMKESKVPVKAMSQEKASKLLPYLKVFLLYNIPRRIDLTSDNERNKDKHYKKKEWQDLTENNNDFKWTTEPIKRDDGYHTAGHTLLGPSANKLDFSKTNELTILIRSRSLQKTLTNDTSVNTVDTSEIVHNAELSNENKELTIVIPSEAKQKFEDLKKLLNDKSQDGTTVDKTLKLAETIKNIIQKYPTVKKQKNPIALKLRGNQGVALEIAIPDGASPDGSLQVTVAGKLVPTQFKVMASNDNYYTIVYRETDKGGHIMAYVNRTQIVSHHDVPFLHLTDHNIQINPSGSWNSALKEVSILNRALNPTEIALFRSENSKSPVLSALTRQYDKDNLVPGIDPPKNCKCIGECKVPGMKSFNPYKPHEKIPDGEKADCKAVCICDGKKPYDPYNPNRIPDPSEFDEYNVPLGPGGEWINPYVCPPVTRDCDGNYVWNGVSYGNSRRKAREIYRINNPYCRVLPKELDDWWNRNQPLRDECPFKIDSNWNPCRREACENVDWSSHSPRNLNKECKRNIGEYCRNHAGLDDFCTCWRPEFKNNSKCQEYRAKFENPKEYGFGPSSFKIEEHPDYDNYIRKDKIPCWGCDLEQSSGRETCEPKL